MTVEATHEKQLVESLRTGLFIGGEWRDAGGGQTFDVEDPATGQVLTRVADATPEDGMAALAAAAGAQAAWAPPHRGSGPRSCAGRSRRSPPGPTSSPC